MIPALWLLNRAAGPGVAAAGSALLWAGLHSPAFLGAGRLVAVPDPVGRLPQLLEAEHGNRDPRGCDDPRSSECGGGGAAIHIGEVGVTG
jgi:hypothetical protein